MSKNNSAAVKIYIVFFIVFPSIFQEKYMQNQGKTTESRSMEQNRVKIQVGTELGSGLFHKKFDFGLKFGVPLAPRGVRGASQNSFIFPSIFACVEKPVWNVPREAPEPPQTSPWHLPGTILRRFWMHFSGAFSLAHVGKRIQFCRDASAVFCYFPQPFP